MGEERGLSFEARFGTLRSLLQGEGDGASFSGVVRELVSMMHMRPARFEDEVLPYAQAMLERWYQAHPVRGIERDGPFVVGRDRALSALMQQMSWLEAVRDLHLGGLKKERLWRALAYSERLGRLEALSLDGASCSEAELVEVLCARWMERAAALSLRQVRVDEALGKAWGEQGPSALRCLDLRGAQLRGASLGSVARLAELERLWLPGMTQRELLGVLEQARWRRLRELAVGYYYSAPVGDVEAAAIVDVCGGGLEALTLGRQVLSEAGMRRVLEEAGPLESLIAWRSDVYWEGRAQAGRWSLDVVLAALPGLRRLELDEVRCAGALEGGQLLETLIVTRCDLGVIEALAKARGLGRLRMLWIEVEPALMERACELLASASLDSVRELELGMIEDGGALRALLRGSWLRGVDWLGLRFEEGALYSVLAALLEEGEEALPALRTLSVPYHALRQARASIAGTWLDEKVTYERFRSTYG